MNDVTIPQYSSSEENTSVVFENYQPKRRKKTDKNWTKEKVFSSKVLALESLKNEGIWSYYHRNIDKEGNVSNIYRCNKVQYRGEQCASGVYLHYPADSEEVILYRSELPHNCDSITSKSKDKISDDTKTEIKTLIDYDPKIKPNKILEILAKKALPIPKKYQLNNHLAILRTSKFVPNAISISEIEKFCIDNCQIPEDENETFIISHNIDYDPPSFRFFISTKNLIRSSINSSHIHADATHKLIWQGFPVLVLGTTDRNRTFHIFGIVVCANDQTEDFIFVFQSLKTSTKKFFDKSINLSILICDGSQSIQNAFKNVFGPNVTIKMCYTHMKKYVRKKVEQLIRPKEYMCKIIEDIDSLQLSKDPKIFDVASAMFVSKWEMQVDFMNYFRYECLELNRNWYEGVDKNTPSTNDALESFNKVIKNENTIREKLPLSRFTEILKNYVTIWSQKYSSDLKVVDDNPIIDLQLWTKSYQWAKEGRMIISKIMPSCRVYIIPSDSIDVCQEELETSWQKSVSLDFHNFDEYKTVMFSVWTLTIPDNPHDWMNGECDCPEYFKAQICKHKVGLAIRLKRIIPPPEAKIIPVGTKRGRGRPAKSNKSSFNLIDNPELLHLE